MCDLMYGLFHRPDRAWGDQININTTEANIVSEGTNVTLALDLKLRQCLTALRSNILGHLATNPETRVCGPRLAFNAKFLDILPQIVSSSF